MQPQDNPQVQSKVETLLQRVAPAAVRDTTDGSQEAKAAIGEINTLVAERKQQKKGQPDSDFYYVYRCNRGHVALFFNDNPTGKGELTPADWWTTYKPKGQPWRGPIFCQECFDPHGDGTGDDGAEECIPCVQYSPAPRNTVKFTPDAAFVNRIAKDKEQAKRDGLHRPYRMQNQAMNKGLPQSVTEVYGG